MRTEGKRARGTSDHPRFRRVVSVLAGAGAIAVGSAGCKTPSDRYRERTEAIATARTGDLARMLEALRAIQSAAAERPALQPIAVGTPLPPAPLRLGLTRAVIAYSETAKLDDPSGVLEKNTCAPVYDGGKLLAIAGGYRREWTNTSDVLLDKAVEDFGRDIDQILQVPYAVVCRTLSVTKPVEGPNKAFTGGDFEGECRVYEIGSRKYVGGFALEAHMSEAKASGVGGSLGMRITRQLEKALAPVGGHGPSRYDCTWQ